jgi:hypothetical protein
METNDRLRQYLKNQMPDEYRRLLRIEQENQEAMELPKDEMTLRLEALGFKRIAITAMSDTHYFSSPCDKNGESTITIQKGEAIYNKWGELSISYEQGVDVWKSCGHIFKEGFYTLEEFNRLLRRMERSRWYRGKKDIMQRLPLLTMLQRKVYDALPITFPWSQGKRIAVEAGMPSRTAQRFFSKQSLFRKVKNGIYMKRIIYSET